MKLLKIIITNLIMILTLVILSSGVVLAVNGDENVELTGYEACESNYHNIIKINSSILNKPITFSVRNFSMVLKQDSEGEYELFTTIDGKETIMKCGATNCDLVSEDGTKVLLPIIDQFDATGLVINVKYYDANGDERYTTLTTIIASDGTERDFNLEAYLNDANQVVVNIRGKTLRSMIDNEEYIKLYIYKGLKKGKLVTTNDISTAIDLVGNVGVSLNDDDELRIGDLGESGFNVDDSQIIIPEPGIYTFQFVKSGNNKIVEKTIILLDEISKVELEQEGGSFILKYEHSHDIRLKLNGDNQYRVRVFNLDGTIVGEEKEYIYNSNSEPNIKIDYSELAIYDEVYITFECKNTFDKYEIVVNVPEINIEQGINYIIDSPGNIVASDGTYNINGKFFNAYLGYFQTNFEAVDNRASFEVWYDNNNSSTLLCNEGRFGDLTSEHIQFSDVTTNCINAIGNIDEYNTLEEIYSYLSKYADIYYYFKAVEGNSDISLYMKTRNFDNNEIILGIDEPSKIRNDGSERNKSKAYFEEFTGINFDKYREFIIKLEEKLESYVKTVENGALDIKIADGDKVFFRVKKDGIYYAENRDTNEGVEIFFPSGAFNINEIQELKHAGKTTGKISKVGGLEIGKYIIYDPAINSYKER